VTRIGGASYRVIGVLPDRVRVPFGANVWVLSDGKRLASDSYFRSLVAIVRGDPAALKTLGAKAKYQAQPLDEYLEPRGVLALTLIAAVGLLVLLAMWSQLASLQATQSSSASTRCSRACRSARRPATFDYSSLPTPSSSRWRRRCCRCGWCRLRSCF